MRSILDIKDPSAEKIKSAARDHIKAEYLEGGCVEIIKHRTINL